MDLVPDFPPFPKITRTLLSSPPSVFAAAVSLRVVLTIYGVYQDSTSAFKYTDIDYVVFTDAARYVSRGYSPYSRETYRYTPLLAWILVPTTWGGRWFSFGKALFAAADIVAGWFILAVLQKKMGMDEKRALKYASIWLLNPMVATISTRGSSEGLLCVMVMALLWATLERRIPLAGGLLGLSVHFKIYPFIYGISIIWFLEPPSSPVSKSAKWHHKLSGFFNTDRLTLAFISLATFSFLNLGIFFLYNVPFIQHTYLHHLVRIDHRHNFSPYNTLLYLSSSVPSYSHARALTSFESLAFLPQLTLSAVAIPIALAKKSLPAAMLAQTFAFVTFNKVCTSQYFLWYLIFLPLYLPNSSFIRNPRLGLLAAGLWVAAQALWLQQGYQLEFLGRSSFVPGLWLSSLLFFGVNVWILGIIIDDAAFDEVGDLIAATEGNAAAEDKQKKQDEDDDSDVEEIGRGSGPRRKLRSGDKENLNRYMADITNMMGMKQPESDSE